MLAVRVGPDDGVIMEALSEQGLVDHCVIVDGSQAQRGDVVTGVGDVITTSSTGRSDVLVNESTSPTPNEIVTSAHNFPQPVTRIIYHHGGGQTAALLVGQQLIQQQHAVLSDEGDEEGALLEEQALSPQHAHQLHAHHHHQHHHHHFKQEVDEQLRAHSALINASQLGANATSVVISEEGSEELVETKHLHRHQILLHQAEADNSDTVYQTDNELEGDEMRHSEHHHPGTILVVKEDTLVDEDDPQCMEALARHSAHNPHHHHFSHPSHHHHHHHQMDKDVECDEELQTQTEEHERHQHLHHHQSHILGTLVSTAGGGRIGSSGNGVMLTDGGTSAEHRVRDTLTETDGVCTVVHGSTPTIIISSGSSANGNNMSTTNTVAKPTTISSSSSSSASLTRSSCSSNSSGGGELGGRGSAQHWLSAASTPAATLIENNGSGSNNTTTRLVVVTSNPSSVQQTLTLHRIVTQVKHELIQTAAEDLSLSNNNNNHNNNHSNSSSNNRIQQQQQPQQSSISPLIISQGRLTTASGPSSVAAAALRGEELTVIVGRNSRQVDYLEESPPTDTIDTRGGRQTVYSHELQTHQQHAHVNHGTVHEPDSDLSNSNDQEQLGCESTQHLHHAHHHHQHVHHTGHHHHQHHHHNHSASHVEEEVDDEEEEEPVSPSNTNNTDGHIEADRVSMSSMIDASEFRALHAAASAEHSYQVALTTVHNGRLSPTGFSPGTSGSSQYATLTPLQPLPPISTMTDKFSYGHAAGNVAGSFTVMQHNGLAGLALASNPYSNYEKMAPMCVSPPHHYSASPVNGIPGEHLSSSQANGMRPDHMSSPPPKSPNNNGYSPSFPSPTDQSSRHRNTPSLSPSQMQQSSSVNHPPTPVSVSSQQQQQQQQSSQQSVHQHHHHHSNTVSSLLIHPQQSAGNTGISTNGVASPNSSSHSSPPLATAVVVAHRDASSPGQASPPLSVVLTGASSSHPHISHTQSVGTVLNSVSVKQQQSAVSVVPSSVSPGGVVTLTSTPAGSGGSISSAGSTSGELEEINTKELAARISAELKRYSIPQAIFAQRVLCRSQGTLSDLLRNPKPWSKLKSGRETFRRMWKWLQEPEFQRMSALRLAGLWINLVIHNG